MTSVAGAPRESSMASEASRYVAPPDLVERLRDYARWTREANDGNNPDPYSKITIDDMDAEMLDEAASEIERLRDAVGRANDKMEYFEREWYLRGDEIERLRKALDWLSTWPGPDGTRQAKAMAEYARKALKHSGEPETSGTLTSAERGGHKSK